MGICAASLGGSKWPLKSKRRDDAGRESRSGE